MSRHLWLFIATIVCCTMVSVLAFMKSGYDPPKLYKQCYGRMKKRCGGNTKKIPGVEVATACDNYYMWHTAQNTILHRKSKPKTLDYIGRLMDQAGRDIAHHRRKRQAGILGPDNRHNIPVRKELRMMSDYEIDRFFRAINSAKNNRSAIFEQNKYDDIANFHTGITAVTAHGGCNFHGWHRAYSYIMEQALREEGPEFADLTIPYWYNPLEARMPTADPETNEAATQSALFSDRLMGSCSGRAVGGIFGPNGWNSSIGEIIRNCGQDGPIMSDGMIYNVTRQRRMRDICGEDSEIFNDLENAHNGVHRWIDGNMALLSTSVFDPIFWLHHVFVDMVWEEWRHHARRVNRDDPNYDVTLDYPLNPTIMGAADAQVPDAPMGFPIAGQENVTVIDGLSDVFTERFFRYAPPPTCTIQRPDCGSKYIKCVIDRPRGAGGRPRAMCVARTLQEVIEWEEEQARPPPQPCPDPPRPPIDPPIQPPIDPPIHPPIDPPIHPPIDPPIQPPTEPPILPPIDPPIQPPIPPKRDIIPIQNTFCLNGKCDSNQWAVFPIKLIIRRPPEYKEYGSYPVEHGRINKIRGDIYSPGAYSNVNRHFRNTDRAAVYEDCQSPDEPTNEIYIKSIGLNYEGIYKEFAIIDRRLPMTVATSYMAVRKPTSDIDESIAMLHAQDRCGRVCKPICKVPGTEVFKPCSGAVALTGKYPLMFGNSFGDAVLDVWDFNTDKSCPQLTTQNIMISFYCDYTSDWIWPTEEPPVTTHNTMGKPLPPLAQTKQTPGCVVGYRCTVMLPCSHMVPCEEGRVYECHNACHGYGVCARGKFFMTYCMGRGETYDPRVKKCVRGYCNPRTSGVQNPIARRVNMRRGRLGLGRARGGGLGAGIIKK